MAVSDAVAARAMATYHKRSVDVVVRGMGEINALLRLILNRKKIKWDGHGDKFEWAVGKLEEEAEWYSGELGTNTFEELDPAQKASLAYCFLKKTYGVGEATIKTNRANGYAKLVDLQAENAREAQMAMYRSIVAALYSDAAGTSKESGPAGLRTITANAYSSATAVTVDAGQSYAGITMNTSAISAWSANKAGFDQKWWAPEVIDIDELPGGTSKWSTDCLIALAWMPMAMAMTQDVSGTGKITTPDLALMNTDPFFAVWVKLIGYKGAAGPINLTNEDFKNVGIRNVLIGDLTCVLDTAVPADASGYERVFVLDSKQFVLETLNTKAEGLIENEFDSKDPKVDGAVGIYRSNLGLRISTPSAAGCVTGCND